MAKSMFKMIITQVLSFIIFILVIALLNVLKPYINNDIFAAIVYLLTSNIILFLAIMLISIINEIFWRLYFPFNILAPISAASLAVFIVIFIYRFFQVLEGHTNVNVLIFPVDLISSFVFVFTLLIGYFIVFVRIFRPKKVHHEKAKEPEKKKMEGKKEIPKEKKDIVWEDVSKEFKEAAYVLGKDIKEKVRSEAEAYKDFQKTSKKTVRKSPKSPRASKKTSLKKTKKPRKRKTF